MSHDRAKQFIEAATACEKLQQLLEFLPSRESYVRELLKLETDEQRAEVWQQLNVESQRAMVASKLATLKHGGDRKSDQIKVSNDTLIGDAAKQLNVSNGRREAAYDEERETIQGNCIKWWSFQNGRSKAKSGTPIGEVIAAAKANPLAEHGEVGNGRKDESRVDNVNSTKGGNATDYTLRRLARDCPEMLDRIEAGKLLAEMENAKTGPRLGNSVLPNSLADIGITKMQSSRWQLAAKRTRSRLVDAF